MKKKEIVLYPANRDFRLSKFGVIEKLTEFGVMSRSELAERLNLSRPALTALSKELIDLDLVREISVQHNGQRQGRPAVLLGLNRDYGYFVGVCITDHPPILVLCDMHGNVLGSHEIPASSDPEGVAAGIEDGIHHFLREQRIKPKKILGIGIAISGFVDRTRGVCILSNELHWSDVPIADIVHRATGIPAFLENDANAVTTGEKLFGHARTIQDFTVITVGQAIGAGHHIDGKLYRGSDGGAGEIGHATVEINGLPCPCGKNGCLDMIAGSRTMIALANQKGLAVESILDLESLARNGARLAIDILYRAGQALGLTVAQMIQSNNPQSVFFVFSENIAGGIFLTITRQTIENNILPRFVSSTSLLFHQMSKDFWARGAASIAAHEFFRYQASL